MLERVQRRATKIIPKLISYEMHLRECGLTTLKDQKIARRSDKRFKNIEWV